MAAAGIVTIPVHVRMNSPRAFDLRKCIENQIMPQTSLAGSAQVLRRKAEDSSSKEHDTQHTVSTTFRNGGGESTEETQSRKDANSLLKVDSGHEKRLRDLSERLLAAEAEQQRLRDSAASLERERETWSADKERWAAERRLLVDAALEIRRMRNETESDTSRWLQRLASAAGADGKEQLSTSETDIRPVFPASQYMNLTKEWLAATSARRKRHSATVAALRAEMSADLLELCTPVLEDDITEAPAADETLPSIEDEDESTALSCNGSDHSPREGVAPVENSDSSPMTAGAQRAAAEPPGNFGSFLLEQYMKVYSLVYGFKAVMAKITKSEDDSEPIVSDQTFPTFEEIESMTTDIGKVLRTACSAMDAALNSDIQVEQTPKPEVSDAGHSDTEEQQFTEEMAADAISEAEVLHHRIINLHAAQKIVSDVQMDDVRSNAAVIAVMQDQVKDLREQLDAANNSKMEISQSSQNVAVSPDASPLFTRLDGERNTKILKRAMTQNRIGAKQAHDAIRKMDAYLDLSRQRLRELTANYIYQASAEPAAGMGGGGATHSDRRFDQQEHELLAKMESLQAVRQKQWAHKMEALAKERSQMAAGLVEVLETIEKDTGLFLVKPTLSYQHSRTLEQRRKSTRPETTVHDSRSWSSSATGQCGQQSARERRRAYSSMDVARSPTQSHAHREQLKRGFCSSDSGKGPAFGATSSPSSGPFVDLLPERCYTALQRPKALTRSSVAPTATWTYQPPSSSPPAPPATTAVGTTASSGRLTAHPPQELWLAAPRILALDIHRFTFAHERTAAPVTSEISSTSGLETRRRRSGGTTSATTRSYVTVARATRLPAGVSSRVGEASGGLATEISDSVGNRAPLVAAPAQAILTPEAPRNDRAKISEHVTIPAVRHSSATRPIADEDAEAIVESAVP